MRFSSVFSHGWLCGVLVLPVAARAQSTSGPPGASSNLPTSGEVIQLSPFIVDTSADRGYMATNTLSGSRVNTPLYTTPSVTSVFTREFLDDIAANDLVDAYAFAVNTVALEQPGQSNNFRGNIFSDHAVNIRGLSAATARNFFVWSVNGDSYNLDRIDFSRGPNNILFGLGGQGGVVNSTTKRAVIGVNRNDFQARVGQWDLYRGHLDVNKTIGNKFALRLNLLYHDQGDWVNHAFYDRRAAHLAGTWRIFETQSAGTTLRLDYERLGIDRVIGYRFPFQDRASSWSGAGIPASGSLTGVTGTISSWNPPRRIFIQGSGGFISSAGLRQSDGPTGTSFLDDSTVPREFNLFGPQNRNDSDVTNHTAVIEQRLFNDLHIELATNRQADDTAFNQIDGFYLRRDPHLVLPNGSANPYFGDYFAEFWYQDRKERLRVDEHRLTTSYLFDAARFGKHQLAALLSRREQRNRVTNFSFDDATLNQPVLVRRYVRDGDSAAATTFNPAAISAAAAAAGHRVGYRQGTLTHSENRQDTAQIVHVGEFFDGRLTTVFGIRRDRLSNRSILNGTRDVDVNENGIIRRREWNNPVKSGWNFQDRETTHTKGLTLGWSAESPIRIYYNESDSFVNQTGNLYVDLIERNPNFPPRRGVGKDYGIRFRTPDHRIAGSLGFFETEDQSAIHFLHGFFPQATLFVANLFGMSGWGSFGDTIDLSSRGAEFELTANPTRNWRLHFNYARTNLETSNHGPRAKSIILGQQVPEWSRWVGGWRAGPNETLPSGVVNNTAAAVNVPGLSRPLTFQEAHGGAIDPHYNRGDRGAAPTVTGAAGLADWISRVNYSSDIWFQDGMPPRRHVRDMINLRTHYTFDNASRLNGWSVGGGARVRGKPIVDRHFDSQGNIVLVKGDWRMTTDLSIGYARRIAGYPVRTQVNVQNLFNSGNIETINVRGNADERGHLRFHDPRNFRLTVDLQF
jgi:iron complex outermembrane recepter protein